MIAILAAVGVVAYRGVTGDTRETALKSDLQAAATQLRVTLNDTNSYPETAAGLPRSEGVNFTYTRYSATDFCLQGTHERVSGKVYYVFSTGTVTEGVCPATMQAFTDQMCQSLESTMVIPLIDTRDGNRYDVGRMPDGKCWMLTNLRLGSASSTTLLTPATSDVASNFTLPTLSDSWGWKGTPDIYDPYEGNSSVTNYGYQYNWTAATAGATSLSVPIANTDAPHSICPAGWMLPSGQATTGDFPILGIAFGADNGFGQSSDIDVVSKWVYPGAFRVVLPGGSSSTFWSKTVNTHGYHSGDYAAYAQVSPYSVRATQGSASMTAARSIRCLLK